MNSKQWRTRGYHTIFRNGHIYLYRPLSGIVIHAAIRSGNWMQFDKVNEAPWECAPQGIDSIDPELASDFQRTHAACYCDKGVDTCDFCAGIRRSPEPDRPTLASRVTDVLHAHGVEITDEAGFVRGCDEIVDDVRGALDSLTKKPRA